jgi:UPF0755 protein
MAALAGYSFYQWHQPVVASETTVIINPGTGTRGIIGQLHEHRVLPAPWSVALPLMASGNHHRLKAGEYVFAPGMTAAQVIDKLAKGQVVVHSVTIPEGFSSAQVRARLMAEPLLTGDLPPVLGEGSLFPDTWLFQRGDTRASVVGRMQARMQRELAAAWAGRDADLPLVSPQEALILASIVEEETGIAAERGLVASVYLNRLELPMRLQSDPTVAYGLAPAGLKRLLTTADLARDTPYNTYTRDGLPPGPITNPGRAALEAVMHPVKTDYLYFVATGGGGHNFSAGIKEHEANVRSYRAAVRAQKRVGR